MAILVLPRHLDALVEQLPEVGKANAGRLNKLGIQTVRDLLLTLPYGWDRSTPAPSAALIHGAQASVIGPIVTIRPVMTQRRRMRLIEAIIADDSGAQMRAVWFHSPFILKQLHPTDRVAFAGMVEKNPYRGQLGMVNPQHERLDAVTPVVRPPKVSGMTPRYHLVECLSSRKIAGWVELVLPLADQLEDLLPEEVRQQHQLLGIAAAVSRGHKPESEADC